MYNIYLYNTYDKYQDEKRRFDITDKLNFTLGITILAKNCN